MPSYRTVYERLASRAIAQGEANLEALVGQLVDQGMSLDRIEELLLEDLATDGPIFENFFRALSGAGQSAVMTAERQGAVIAQASDIEDLRQLGNLDDVIDDADPDLLDEIENRFGGSIEMTWVATLVNTCPVCLPFHGTTRTLEEWKQITPIPPNTHPTSWTSTCHCQLVERKSVDTAGEIAPLLRVKEKGSRRTVRGIASKDIETAKRARDKALESKAGRRTLRLLGQAKEIGDGRPEA